MSEAGNITRDGARLVEAWQHAKDQVRTYKGLTANAIIDMETAEKALIEWLLPADAQIGEKICVWYGEALIQAEVIGRNPTKANLSIRKGRIKP